MGTWHDKVTFSGFPFHVASGERRIFFFFIWFFLFFGFRPAIPSWDSSLDSKLDSELDSSTNTCKGRAEAGGQNGRVKWEREREREREKEKKTYVALTLTIGEPRVTHQHPPALLLKKPTPPFVNNYQPLLPIAMQCISIILLTLLDPSTN